jgi:hypothetical protein
VQELKHKKSNRRHETKPQENRGKHYAAAKKFGYQSAHEHLPVHDPILPALLVPTQLNNAKAVTKQST